jgi:hypothetical protein
MNDQEYQISQLKSILSAASFAPVFRSNPKYQVDGTARIGYNDIMSCNYIIKCDTTFPESGGFWSGEGAQIIAKYNSISMLVDDGWRLG